MDSPWSRRYVEIPWMRRLWKDRKSWLSGPQQEYIMISLISYIIIYHISYTIIYHIIYQQHIFFLALQVVVPRSSFFYIDFKKWNCSAALFSVQQNANFELRTKSSAVRAPGRKISGRPVVVPSAAPFRIISAPGRKSYGPENSDFETRNLDILKGWKNLDHVN